MVMYDHRCEFSASIVLWKCILSVLNRPFLHSTSIRTNNSTRERLGLTFSYICCIFVHPDLTLVPLFAGMQERFIYVALRQTSDAENIYMLLAGWEICIGKNCDRGLENAAWGRRPRAAFSSPRSQFFTIRTDPKPDNNMFILFSCSKLAHKWVDLLTQICHSIGLRAVYKPFVKNLTSERASIYYTKKDVLKNRFFANYFVSCI